MVAFGVKQGLLASTPCAQIDPPDREQRLQRVLTEDWTPRDLRRTARRAT
jgi:hypothetical protein